MSDVDNCSSLSEEEIHAAISQMMNGKAPRIGQISAELLKLGGDECVHWLKVVFDFSWEHESIPKDRKSHILVPLHKEDSHNVCDNCRGIALLCISSNVFAKAILNRL